MEIVCDCRAYILSCGRAIDLFLVKIGFVGIAVFVFVFVNIRFVAVVIGFVEATVFVSVNIRFYHKLLCVLLWFFWSYFRVIWGYIWGIWGYFCVILEF